MHPRAVYYSLHGADFLKSYDASLGAFESTCHMSCSCRPSRSWLTLPQISTDFELLGHAVKIKGPTTHFIHYVNTCTYTIRGKNSVNFVKVDFYSMSMTSNQKFRKNAHYHNSQPVKLAVYWLSNEFSTSLIQHVDRFKCFLNIYPAKKALSSSSILVVYIYVCDEKKLYIFFYPHTRKLPMTTHLHKHNRNNLFASAFELFLPQKNFFRRK